MKNIRILINLTAAAALCGASALAQAAAGDTPAASLLEIKYDWTARERPEVARVSACPVHIVATLDERQNKETIGANFGGPLVTGVAAPWATEGLMSLKNYGLAVDEVAGGSVPAEGVTVKTTLTRAYTWQVGIKLFSMVALKAQFLDRNGVLQEKYYRAHGDKTNMWGADSEFVTTLNYGINNLVPALARDLVSLCKGEKVDAYTYAGPDPAPKK